MPVEQPAGFKPPPLGAPPHTPQGRWTRAAAKSPAARPPPPAIPKEGVTSNHPLTERPPIPEIPHAIAPVTALREEIAFGDLKPIQQPIAPTSDFDARREAGARTIPVVTQPLDVPEVPTPTVERNRNKLIASPKTKTYFIRTPPRRHLQVQAASQAMRR